MTLKEYPLYDLRKFTQQAACQRCFKKDLLNFTVKIRHMEHEVPDERKTERLI